jgi:hypothetical protein
MPINRTGRYTSQKQYSRWDIMQAQRQFHAQASQKYLSNASDAVSRLQSAFSNQITGAGNLTAEIALKRIQTTTALARQAAQGIDIST